jgi:hypothetical protein
VFWYSIAWLIGLLVLAALYNDGHFRGLLAGVSVAALATVWSGALGGVAISLKGVYDHWADASKHPDRKTGWNNELLLWHIGRPASGLIVGIAVFILIKAVYPSGTPSAGAMASVAFVLGLQEKRFFAWVKQVGEVVVAVPAKGSKQGLSTTSESENGEVVNADDAPS